MRSFGYARFLLYQPAYTPQEDDETDGWKPPQTELKVLVRIQESPLIGDLILG